MKGGPLLSTGSRAYCRTSNSSNVVAVHEGVNELAGRNVSPPQQRRGGAKRRGGVGPVIDFLIEPFFVASPYRARVRSAHARRFAAPLLCQGGEFALFRFIHTLTDRAYRGSFPNFDVRQQLLTPDTFGVIRVTVLAWNQTEYWAQQALRAQQAL